MEDMNAVISEIKISQNFSLVECPGYAYCSTLIFLCNLNILRRCERATYIKKEDFNQSNVIDCPSPGCKYMWCKMCNWATRDDTQPEARLHSCEGAVELRNLVNEEGWRYCPGGTTKPLLRRSFAHENSGIRVLYSNRKDRRL